MPTRSTDRDASTFALKADLPKQGGASCPGVGFYPINEGINYMGSAPRTSISTALPTGSCVRCSFLTGRPSPGSRPASMTHHTNEGSACFLGRMDVTGGRFSSGNGTGTTLATTNTTTQDFGNQTVSTTAIADPVVDAGRYSCQRGVQCGGRITLGHQRRGRRLHAPLAGPNAMPLVPRPQLSVTGRRWRYGTLAACPGHRSGPRSGHSREVTPFHAVSAAYEALYAVFGPVLSWARS